MFYISDVFLREVIWSEGLPLSAGMEQMLLDHFERPSSKRPSFSLPEGKAEEVEYVEM